MASPDAAYSVGSGREGHAGRRAAFELPSSLALTVLQHLPPNDIACTARLVCKETAQHFSSHQHRTVRLNQPLPRHTADWWRYCQARLPRQSPKLKLPLLATAAATGCETNLEVVWHLLQPLPLVVWVPLRFEVEWWLAKLPAPIEYHVARDPGIVAARHGHGHLLPWLLEHGCLNDPRRTLEAVALHCSLAALQWAAACLPLPADKLWQDAEAVARSRTADALDKLAWLLSLPGFDQPGKLVKGAAQVGDVSRLQWLVARGVPVHRYTLMTVLESPVAGVEAVEWLEQQGVGSVADGLRSCWKVSPHKLEWAASRAGVQVRQSQWDEACVGAARAGDLQLVAHLHEAHGSALSPAVRLAAWDSGNSKLQAWLKGK